MAALLIGRLLLRSYALGQPTPCLKENGRAAVVVRGCVCDQLRDPFVASICPNGKSQIGRRLAAADADLRTPCAGRARSTLQFVTAVEQRLLPEP